MNFEELTVRGNEFGVNSIKHTRLTKNMANQVTETVTYIEF